MKMLSRLKHTFCSALVLVCLCVPLAAESDTAVVKDRSGKRVGAYSGSHALMLAVDEYTDPWSARPGALQSAGELKGVLENLGFDVTLVANPETRSLRKLLVDFINRYGQAEDNRLLIYFSGHCYDLVPRYGADAMEYLVPARAPDPGKDLLGFRDSSLSFFHLDTYARNIRSRHVLFLFEGCRKGTALALQDGDDSQEITAPVFNMARQFILLGGPEKPGAGFHRAFLGTRLLAALKGEADLNADGYVTASEVARFLQRENRKHPEKRETLIYGELKGVALQPGDFVFPLPPGQPQQPETVAHTDLPKAPVARKGGGSPVKPSPAPRPLPATDRTNNVSAPPDETAETRTPAPQPVIAVAEELAEEKHDQMIFWPPDETTEEGKLFSIEEETFSHLRDFTMDKNSFEKLQPADLANPGDAVRLR